MTTVDRYAVFGCPIKHSKSPQIHRLFAEQTQQSMEYFAQEVAAEAFKTSVEHFFNQGGKGLNCTLPLKELAWAFADRRTPRAEVSKAVNTLALQNDGSILGDNTDGCGLIRDLTANHNAAIKAANVLVLGAGGASRGILAPLLELAPRQLVLANRTPQKAVLLAAELSAMGKIEGCGFDDLKNQQFDVIINATSASLSDEIPPLAPSLLAKNGLCYDLAYGNSPTAFVRWGLVNHARLSLDGLGMLVEQAAEAFLVWRQIRPETQRVITALNNARQLN